MEVLLEEEEIADRPVNELRPFDVINHRELSDREEEKEDQVVMLDGERDSDAEDSINPLLHEQVGFSWGLLLVGPGLLRDTYIDTYRQLRVFRF
jgi:hypothetical protein